MAAHLPIICPFLPTTYKFTLTFPVQVEKGQRRGVIRDGPEDWSLRREIGTKINKQAHTGLQFAGLASKQSGYLEGYLFKYLVCVWHHALRVGAQNFFGSWGHTWLCSGDHNDPAILFLWPYSRTQIVERQSGVSGVCGCTSGAESTLHMYKAVGPISGTKN